MILGVQPEVWNAVAAISQVVASVVAIVGIIYIARQVADTRRFTRGQLLNELEKESGDYRDVYLKVTGEWAAEQGSAPTEHELQDVFDALGWYVRIKLLLDSQVIDLPTVDAIFAYRFFLLVNNRTVQQYALYPDGDSFAVVFALHKQWSDYRRSRGEPIAHEATDLRAFNLQQYDGFVATYERRP